MYDRDLEELKKKFANSPNKGPMAEETLASFIETKSVERETLIATNTFLSELDKQMANEKAKNDKLQREKERQEKELEKSKQELENYIQAHTAQVNALMQKQKQELARVQQEAESQIERRVAERKKMMEAGFTSQAKRLEDEIARIRQEQQRTTQACQANQSQLLSEIQRLNQELQTLRNSPPKVVEKVVYHFNPVRAVWDFFCG